jgi:ribonuclease HI
MNDPTPHYLLVSETSRTEGCGRWRFVLRCAGGPTAIEAADVEPDIWGERLDLLTVVRALEALDQPSRVTLVGCTRYVEQGVSYGLTEWRNNDWRWERFGQMVPVRDVDLWQRMDQILQFHRVECRQRRFDAGHVSVAGPHRKGTPVGVSCTDRIVRGDWVEYCVPALAAWCGVWMKAAVRFWQRVTVARGQGSGARVRWNTALWL